VISLEHVDRLNKVLKRLEALIEIDTEIGQDLCEDIVSSAENRLDTFESIVNTKQTIIL
jgi:hypothetical protein